MVYGYLSSIKTRERGKRLSCNKIRNSEHKGIVGVLRFEVHIKILNMALLEA